MNTLKRIARKVRNNISPTKIFLVIIVLAVVIWQIFKPEKLLPRHTVDRGIVERVVFASGKVEVSNQVSQGFQQSGVVSNVYVKTGSRVKKGQLLARLDLGTLSADLREARANLTDARYKKSRSELDVQLSSTQLSSDTTNASANLEALRIKLLSSDLQLFPIDTAASDVSVAPSITGTYIGLGEKATFEVSFYRSSAPSGISARVIGDNTNATISLSSTYPTAIGTSGLYMQLAPDTSGLADTKWKLELPNVRSPQYSSNLYQFLEAKKNYENSLKSQTKEISLVTKGYNGYTEYDIAIERASAALDRVNQSIRLKGIYAPFDGTIGRIDIKPGQSVSGNTDVVTILGKGELQTKLRIPESSVGAVHTDDPVVIMPDVDTSQIYNGSISSINQSETYVEGTPVYETAVIIENPKNLKPGMTVRGKITTDKVLDTVRAPELALYEKEDGSFYVKKITKVDSNETMDVPVVIGLKGTDGFIAIENGVSAGDQLVLREATK